MSKKYGLKFVVNGEDYDKIKKSLNEQIEDLQQKVEQLEKENEKLKYLVDDSHTMKAFIVEHNKVEQLESIIKEAIEYVKNNKETREHYEPYGTPMGNSNYTTTHIFGYYELLDILNKGE